MIITRTPLRISLGGGGTDQPSYYRSFGGRVLAAAITRYIYITLNDTFTADYVIKYSKLERVESRESIDHPIIREALAMHPIGPSIELVSLADIPAGTGLGSSGSFTVGLLRALYAYQREHVTAGAIAEEACTIEIDKLGRAVGKQDQYIAAFGGITCFDFSRDGTVRASPLLISTNTLHDLEENLLMFFTGYSREADQLLTDQKRRSEGRDTVMLDNLNRVKEIGKNIEYALEHGDTTAFGDLMHEHWMYKRKRTPGMSNTCIDSWYDAARHGGAIGGKLVGAGGGGFLLFYVRDREGVREAMKREGLAEVRFTFDHDGSTVMVRA
jgi:D-glycero-alpha-D-manno-heptose-7-phosphate kinase